MNQPVKPGDIWKDNDRRNSYPDGHRTIKIVSIDATYAYGICEQSGKKTKIKLTRFNPDSTTGYTKLKVLQ